MNNNLREQNRQSESKSTDEESIDTGMCLHSIINDLCRVGESL